MIGISRRIGAASIAVIVFAVFTIFPVQAQQNSNNVANGFRISPVRSEFTIEKGQSQTLEITVENPTDVPTVAKPLVNDFIASDKEEGEPRLILDDTTEPPKNSIKRLVEGIQDVPLGPKEKKNITVTIRVPENANAGGYYGAVRFIPSDLGQVDVVGIAASVGSLILVRVPGNLTERLDLLEMTAAQDGKAKGFFTGGNVQSMIRLKNEGDIHVQPFGRVFVKNIFGKEVTSYELNLNNQGQRDNILPGSTRKFVNDLDDKNWVGRYTITANLGYTNGGDLITASTTFWYMPPWAIIVLLLLVVGMAAGGYFLYKKYNMPKPKHGVKKK